MDYSIVNSLAHWDSVEKCSNWDNTAGNISDGIIRWGSHTLAAAAEDATDKSDAEPQYSMVCENSPAVSANTTQQAAIAV